MLYMATPFLRKSFRRFRILSRAPVIGCSSNAYTNPYAFFSAKICRVPILRLVHFSTSAQHLGKFLFLKRFNIRGATATCPAIPSPDRPEASYRERTDTREPTFPWTSAPAFRQSRLALRHQTLQRASRHNVANVHSETCGGRRNGRRRNLSAPAVRGAPLSPFLANSMSCVTAR